jgi:UPF0271 protein
MTGYKKLEDAVAALGKYRKEKAAMLSRERGNPDILRDVLRHQLYTLREKVCRGLEKLGLMLRESWEVERALVERGRSDYYQRVGAEPSKEVKQPFKEAEERAPAVPPEVRWRSYQSSDRRAIVLDAAALILGFTEVENAVAVTSSKVLEEAKDRDAKYRALAAQEGGLIKVMEPEPAYVNEAREAARGLGEIELSEADISVIALALQLSRLGWDTCILTSDYSIQNLASRLGLKVKPILYQGIRRVISWEVYCGACGWAGDGRPGDPCPRCGHKLKRRPRREKR